MEFREMRRFKQALTREECAAILREEKRGTLAVIGDGGWPYALPINFWYDEEADKLPPEIQAWYDNAHNG